MSDDAPYSAASVRRRVAHQFRHLQTTEIKPAGRVMCGAETLVNFASNDYLGLSQRAELIAAAQDCAARYGTGSTASRLITGNHPLYDVIERRLADGKGTEAALVMASGYQANISVLAALADSEVLGKPVTILADRLCHNSLLQGAILSGARLMRYRHNDHDHLETLLREQHAKGAALIIVTESVFGMDGDRADIAVLGALARSTNAMLYVDEAHATGLFGPGGFGVCAEHKGVADIAMGTFGKALGSFGAYIACSAVLRDYLVQRCGGLIYSTALPPPVLGSIATALELLPRLDAERAFVLQQAARLRDALCKQGWNCGASTTQIIPVILGSEEAATELSAILQADGMLVPAIRPPTVPRGSSRLRLSISAAHPVADIDKLITAMARQVERWAVSRQALAS